MGARGPRFAAFDTYHPAVAAAYVLVTLALTMFSVQPVLIALSLAGAFFYGALSRGVRACLRALRWQLPTIVLIALANPLFSASGSTVLVYLGPRAVFVESIAYGCAMGGLFVASVLWFEAAADMLPQDRVMALAGNAAPTIALMVSMCMRLIPEFVRRGRTIAEVQSVVRGAAGTSGVAVREADDAGAGGPVAAGDFSSEETRTAASGRGRRANERGRRAGGDGGSSLLARRTSRASALLRQMHVLMGWSLEDSLETADAMRARGWSASVRRSTYTRFCLCAADAVALVLVLVGGAFCLLLAYAATSQYAFYPTMSRLVVWWGYVPYLAWMFVPSLLLLLERRAFR